MSKKKSRRTNARKSNCCCLKCAWGTWFLSLIAIAIGVGVACLAVVPSVHERFHEDPARDADYVFKHGAAAIKTMYSQTSVDWQVVPYLGYLSFGFADSSFVGLNPDNPETGPPSSLDSIGLILIVWYKDEGRAIFSYFHDKYFASDDPIRLDTFYIDGNPQIDLVYQDTLQEELVRQDGSFPFFAVRYHHRFSDSANLAELHSMLASYIAANSDTEDSATQATVTDTLFNRACASMYRKWDDHFNNLWKRWPTAAGGFMGILSVLISMFWWIRAVPDLYRGYKSLREAHKRYVRITREYPGVIEPPRAYYWLYFRDKRVNGFVSYYRGIIRETVDEIQRQRIAQRQRLEAENQFAEKFNAFLKLVRDTFGDLVPSSILHELTRVADASHTLGDRSYWLSSAMILFQNRFEQNGSMSPEDKLIRYESTLKSQVSAVVVEELSRDRRIEFKAQVDLADQATKTNVRIYHLENAIRVALGHENLLPTKVVESLPDSKQSADSSFLTEEGIIGAFNVMEILPKGIDSTYVTFIILWGLLKVSRRGEVFIDMAYIPETHVIVDVGSKIGSSFNTNTFSQVLTWLVKNGVVLRWRKKGTWVLSLSTKASKASDEGRPVVIRALSFYHEIQRRIY